MADPGRRLIEEWLPIAEIGIESVRERTPMTPFPAPNRLHVWWARRPLVASRAAILASLLPADADRAKFLHLLGIHGDPVAAKAAVTEAKRSSQRVDNPYSYARAFSYTPDADDCDWISTHTRQDGAPIVVLDPTAGGGSIPFEALRLGYRPVANDLNPVAWFVLMATVRHPAVFGQPVLDRYNQFARQYVSRIKAAVSRFYPIDPDCSCQDATYLWARTITCPYCGGLIPLSPNWRLSSDGTGVRLIPSTQTRRCSFEIVKTVDDQSPGTVKGGNGLCPYPDCGRVIDSDNIKEQAQAGNMGDQLYAVVYKQTLVVGQTKAGKPKTKSVRRFRAPRPEDDVSEQVSSALNDKMPEWEARNIVPDEAYQSGTNDERPLHYGMPLWRDMFSPRQRLGHCTSIEVFHDLVDELRRENAGDVTDLDRAALTYVAIAIDKLLNYNARMVRWHANREVVAGVFDRHDFSFKWSYAEMAPTVAGLGYDWAIDSTGKALEELIEMTSGSGMFGKQRDKATITITNGSGDSLALEDASVDCVVMDPPYYDNVMYAELADFFYVWLKRTVGLLYPEQFASYLTDKDREAIANPAKFKGQKGGAKNLAGKDYQHRMQAIFAECRRVLKPDGVMTVMFTHKASGAWDALASGLVEAGFVITASWPVNTEAEGSLHIKEKSAAKSTIFLVCRPQEQRTTGDDANYWEDVEPKVAAVVRERVQEFQDAGIGGVDLYLACFGPALQVFSEHWPLKRGRPAQQPKDVKLAAGEEWDPYAVRPEDALDASRREVKQWRLSKLASMQRQHHLDPLTEWYVLAWDAFKALRFPGDEALKLARVVGLDYDKQVKNVVCEAKGNDVILWDSKARKAKGKLGAVGEDVMLDTLHHCALAGREQNTGDAKDILDKAGLLEDPTLLVALEALLNVLPPPGSSGSGKNKDAGISGAASDCEALEKLRRLAFANEIPEPQYQKLLHIISGGDGDDDDETDEE
jgi:putative DNA methylase